MASTQKSSEWLWQMQEDIQKRINVERRQRQRKKKRRIQLQPLEPSAKELYRAVINAEGY